MSQQLIPLDRRYANWDHRKARITVRDLLRMASGLDADVSDPHSVASENAVARNSRPVAKRRGMKKYGECAIG
jgi:CubicO group peptidase (beta-lactamase class C family)